MCLALDITSNKSQLKTVCRHALQSVPLLMFSLWNISLFLNIPTVVSISQYHILYMCCLQNVWGNFCYIPNTIGRMSESHVDFLKCTKCQKEKEHICTSDFASTERHYWDIHTLRHSLSFCIVCSMSYNLEMVFVSAYKATVKHN